MIADVSLPPLTLCTATAREMKAALRCFPARESSLLRVPDEGAWSETVIGDRACILLLTGVGVINAALALGRLLAARPETAGVLNLGVAGSFDCAVLPQGSAAAVEREIWPEYGLRTEDGVDPRGIRLALGRVGELTVWDRLELRPDEMARAMGLCLPPSLCRAVSLTVSSVTGTAARAERLATRYSCLLENMEGFALAFGCVSQGIPFLQVRTVSNRVGSRAREDWNLGLALDRLGNIASCLFGYGRPTA